MKKMYVSETDGLRRRERPVVGWKGRLRSTSMREMLIEGEGLN